MTNEKLLLYEMEKLLKERDDKILAEGGEIQYETEDDWRREEEAMKARFAADGLLVPEVLWHNESKDERNRKIAHNIKASALMAEYHTKKNKAK